MFESRVRRALLAAGFLLAACGNTHAQSIGAATPPPDSTLYTTYSFSNDYTNVYLSVCGSTQQSFGCYGGATLGPFGRAGALIEGDPVVNTQTQTVTRNIYVVDEADGGAGVKLYVYQKKDAVSPSFDTVTVKLINTIDLPLLGGTRVKTTMAANKQYLFIGTNKSPFAVRVQKRNLDVIQVGGFSPPINVSAITSDQYGYVTVTFGTVSGESGFYLFGPDGNLQEDGGGADILLGTSQGFTTANAGATGPSPAARMKVRYKSGSAEH
jgi:hypothetical protein